MRLYSVRRVDSRSRSKLAQRRGIRAAARAAPRPGRPSTSRTTASGSLSISQVADVVAGRAGSSGRSPGVRPGSQEVARLERAHASSDSRQAFGHERAAVGAEPLRAVARSCNTTRATRVGIGLEPLLQRYSQLQPGLEAEAELEGERLALSPSAASGHPLCRPLRGPRLAITSAEVQAATIDGLISRRRSWPNAAVNRASERSYCGSIGDEATFPGRSRAACGWALSRDEPRRPRSAVVVMTESSSRTGAILAVGHQAQPTQLLGGWCEIGTVSHGAIACEVAGEVSLDLLCDSTRVKQLPAWRRRLDTFCLRNPQDGATVSGDFGGTESSLSKEPNPPSA